jgi:hypothetical protein
MKLVLSIVIILVIAATVVADYKWRRWIASRRRDRER